MSPTSTPMMLLLAAGVALLASTASAAPQAIATCDAAKIKEAMSACDSLVNISQIKCDTTACHKALHLLVDDEYISCYEELKLGSKSDLAKYKELDDFCHGEAPDPLEKVGAATTSGSGTMANAGSDAAASTEKKEESSVTAKPSTVPSPAATPAPTSSAASLAGAATTVALAAVAVSLV